MKINFIKNPTTLGEKIRNRRLALGLTQLEAGKLLGVERCGLVDWENNNTNPTIEFYPSIIKFLSYIPFEFDTTTLGGRVKEYRYRHGLSQERFGKFTGIGPATIYRIEQGMGNLNKKTKALLENVLPLNQSTCPGKATTKGC